MSATVSKIWTCYFIHLINMLSYSVVFKKITQATYVFQGDL